MEPHYQSPLTPEQREALLELTNLMEKLALHTEELLSPTSYTEEEIQELKTLQGTINKFQSIAGAIQGLLWPGLIKASTDIFFRARELAEQGDEKAKEAYEG